MGIKLKNCTNTGGFDATRVDESIAKWIGFRREGWVTIFVSHVLLIEVIDQGISSSKSLLSCWRLRSALFVVDSNAIVADTICQYRRKESYLTTPWTHAHLTKI
jgi:hypothetical protein